MPQITVKSKGASFRRAGMTFTRAGVTLDRETLSSEQLEALVLEPNLVLFDPDSETPEREQIAELEAFRLEAIHRRQDVRPSIERMKELDAANSSTSESGASENADAAADASGLEVDRSTDKTKAAGKGKASK